MGSEIEDYIPQDHTSNAKTWYCHVSPKSYFREDPRHRLRRQLACVMGHQSREPSVRINACKSMCVWTNVT